MSTDPAAMPAPPRVPDALRSLREATFAVGIDIGGTKTHGVAVDSSGNILAEATTPTRLGFDGVVQTASDTCRRLRSALPGHAVASVGVGVPGVVNADTGEVANAVNLRVDHADLGAVLTRQLGNRTWVQNDVNLAALGAWLQDPSAESIALLNLGTGLAVGFVVDGKIHNGVCGAAGEIGHLPVEPQGPRCGCGQRGCLELYVSGSALRRASQSLGLEWVEELFSQAPDRVPGAELAADAFIGRLAWTIQLIALSVNPAVIVLSGGITILGEVITGPLVSLLRRQARQSSFVASLDLAARVRTQTAGYTAAALGAAVYGASASSSSETNQT